MSRAKELRLRGEREARVKAAIQPLGDPTATGMALWFDYDVAGEIQARTPEQRAWDRGVFAAAEYVRRATGDEALSIRIFKAMSTPIESKVTT